MKLLRKKLIAALSHRGGQDGQTSIDIDQLILIVMRTCSADTSDHR
jgi:hypothetical protein